MSTRSVQQSPDKLVCGSGGRCQATNVSLLRLIAAAYDLPVFTAERYISGIPGSISNDRYDLDAKAEKASATGAELRLILQNTLADRFKLHEENKEISGYALVVARGGPKLRRLEVGKLDRPVRLAIGARNTTALTTAFSIRLQAPVIDRSNIQGDYDFNIAWDSLSDDKGASLFTVLEEEFGLKLESAKVQTTILVVNHVEKPTEN